MFKNWSNRDWFWLLGVLIGIIVLLIASIFAKSKNIEVNFGIISSAVSIALALVAIFFAWKQDSDNQAVTRHTTNLLSSIRAKVDGMDTKIDKLDPHKVTRPEKDQLIKDVVEIIQSKDVEENIADEQLIDDVTRKINEKFYEMDLKLKDYYDVKTKENSIKNNTYNYILTFITLSENAEEDLFTSELLGLIDTGVLSVDTIAKGRLKVEFSANSPIDKKIVSNIAKKYGYKVASIEHF
ncbi:hypothetical protein NXZ75_15260 [Lysinibacillus sphaericus]|uniref:hypothetical protein n=1 Tax=Lysinibacillus sphaericus TaxID=1421 RepID=UPI002163CF0A|nr:hypothetical protein [Lysinibacillus sphaericus]MCS1383567.1 hypothetical protein [Lysinibacillus sphaericus]